MALNFPDSPTAGTVFGAWRYDGVKWGAVSGVSGGGSAGDITAVLAGAGLSGGGTEGDVSIALAVPVTVARGGTGGTDAATARTNLGAAPLDQGVTLTGDVSGSGAQNTGIATTLAPVNLATKVTGILPIANGGSGSGTAAAAPWLTRTGVTSGANAAAGEVGEHLESTAAPAAATSGIPKTITTLVLTAGDWQISGWVYGFNASGALTYLAGGLGTTADTFATYAGGPGFASLQGTSLGPSQVSIGAYRSVFSSTLTFHLVGQINVSTGTCQMAGTLFARRMR